MLKGKKIVIGITGSIAAFKIPYLIRLLKKEGAEVRVMMTPAAVDFITPLTLSTLSENPVLVDPFDPVDGTWNNHVELGRWADLYIMAPVSANTIAKMAHGISDNFLLTAYLSAKCPVYFAPAMDLDMYLHAATQGNIKKLQSTGNLLIEPVVGELASGLTGAGRMEEPEKILDTIKEHFQSAKKKFVGMKALVTAGPTYEAIDPVRFIGNHSSGKMGFAIADELAAQGATVTLVTGPTAQTVNNDNISRIDVTTAKQMSAACKRAFKSTDLLIMAAAVADYRPEKVSSSKIKKTDKTLALKLVANEDILSSLADIKKKGQLIAGFALETGNGLKHAKDKLKRKNLDLVVLNTVSEKGTGFGHDTNKVTLIDKSGKVSRYPLKSKQEVARDIVNYISTIIDSSNR
jgi:phosphopantothenoylcysteine decarboxylase/phosphopantothenate--cysteine ligase